MHRIDHLPADCLLGCAAFKGMEASTNLEGLLYFAAHLEIGDPAQAGGALNIDYLSTFRAAANIDGASASFQRKKTECC